MKQALSWGMVLLGGLAAVGTFAAAESGTFIDQELLAPASGGALTIAMTSRASLRAAPAELDPELRKLRLRGEAFFNTPFEAATGGTTVRDGLGPLFNSGSCESCHNNVGRGRPADAEGKPSPSLVLQLSARLPEGGWGPHPLYGSNFNTASVAGVPLEGQVRVSYVPVTGSHEDGAAWELQQPAYHFEQLGYGELADAVFSPRLAQPLFGMGLLDAIADAAILSNADPEDRDGDGISGRPNWIQEGNGKRTLGRFGWKANRTTLRDQIVEALFAEQGITSATRTGSNCAPTQSACLAAPDGGEPEIADGDLDAIVLFMETMAVPARRGVELEEVRRGATLFTRAGCNSCHVPSHTTSPDREFAVLSGQLIYPYTDLLLHDMGPGLADGRPDQEASGSEWRTPPLWGLGRVAELDVTPNFLHDGRARSLEEAVLWHGGEAEAARNAFTAWPATDREALIRFLESL